MEGAGPGVPALQNGQGDQAAPDGASAKIGMHVEFQEHHARLPGEGSIEPERQEADNALVHHRDDVRPLVGAYPVADDVLDLLLVVIEVILVDGFLVKEPIKIEEFSTIRLRCVTEAGFLSQVFQ